MVAILGYTHRALSGKLSLSPSPRSVSLIERLIVLHTPVHQLDKVKSLPPVQIRDRILEAISKANLLGVNKSSVAVNKSHAGNAGVIECVDGFCGCEGVDTD